MMYVFTKSLCYEQDITQDYNNLRTVWFVL